MIYNGGLNQGSGRMHRGAGLLDLAYKGAKFIKDSGLGDIGKEVYSTGSKIAGLIDQRKKEKSGTGRRRKSRKSRK